MVGRPRQVEQTGALSVDPNGVWTDEANVREFGEKANTEDLREAFRELMKDSLA